MQDTINKVRQQLNDYWSNLTKFQKIRLISIVSVSLVLLITLAVIFSRPNYVPLNSSPYSQDTANKVKAVLDDKGYSYQVKSSGGGFDFEVNQKDKDDIILATAKVVNGEGVTFAEEFDKTDISTPNSVLDQKFKEYRQNRIASILKKNQGVEDADVVLTIPEPTVFIDDKVGRKPKATVRLTLSETLSKQQIEGIVAVVAGCVEDLDPKNITVVDSNNVQLNKSTGSSDEDQVQTSHIAIKNKQQERVEEQVKELLSTVSDNVDVAVNLDMDFDNEIQDNVEYKAANADGTGIPSQSKVTKENGKGVDNSNTVPGTTSNSDITQYPATGSNNNYELNKSNEETKYKVSEFRTKREKAPGTVKYDSSSIAVMLKTNKAYTSLSKYNKAIKNQKIVNRNDLLKTIRSATGINNVTVQETYMPMYNAPKGFDVGRFINSFGAFIIAGLLMIGLLIALLRRDKDKTVAENEVDVEDIDMESMADGLKSPTFEAVVSDSEEVPDIELKKDSEIQNQINKFVKEKPDAVAQLLRNWLNEDWE